MKDVRGHVEFNMVSLLEVIKIVSFPYTFLLSCGYGKECNELVWQACAIG